MFPFIERMLEIVHSETGIIGEKGPTIWVFF
jgi:hypothetical protein